MRSQLHEIYARLYAHFGPQHWWPGDSDFEIIVGAILTQNTAWINVEQAITNLRRARLLTPSAIKRIPLPQLAQLIRPAGYFNLKAKKLKAFVRFLFERYHGKLADLFQLDLGTLRDELLAVYGIGPETADSIILYAARKPIFVVDAYTRRIFARLGLAHDQASYADLQALFMANLPHDVPLFNEYHALMVALGKNICVARVPRCPGCPLSELCSTGQNRRVPS